MSSPQSPAGLVVIDKPAGWTSHQVVGRLRRILGLRKVGHAGTLDPMATGVLLVAFGRATRLLGYLAGQSKTYTATIRLGASTTTDDAEGEVIETADATEVTQAQIAAAMAGLRGEIDQVPSSVSAIKVAGKRAYQRVRDGEVVELAARRVTVSRFDVDSVTRVGPFVDLDVTVDCSTGTYIRALARDLGQKLGVGGHLTRLRRTRVGGWQIAEAIELTEETTDVVTHDVDDVAARSFATVTVTAEQAEDIGYGRRLTGLTLDADVVAMLDERGQFLALYARHGRDATAQFVYRPA